MLGRYPLLFAIKHPTEVPKGRRYFYFGLQFEGIQSTVVGEVMAARV